MRTVADIMTRELQVLHEEDSLAEVERKMELYSLRHLPVVDGSRLVGLVTHRDLLRWSAAQLPSAALPADVDAQAFENTFVVTVMTRDVQTVAPETSIADAARTLIEAKFGCLPVVDLDGNLAGIVTEHDLVKVMVSLLELDQSALVGAIKTLHRSPSLVDESTRVRGGGAS